MQRPRQPGEARETIDRVRAAGRRIALVPTMGNLHAGHLSLVKRARQAADFVAVSIFVNPLQFGPDEDYEHYPRTLEADVAKLQAAGVDLVYAPELDSVYPGGYPPATTVRLSGHLTETLEGAHRPGHFEGVATVVSILFNQLQPDVAVFGEKDWQQLAIIRRMTLDLSLGVEIIGLPIVRTADGLAQSSRNQYLSAAERATAPRLHEALQAVAAALKSGRRDFEPLCRQRQQQLAGFGFETQYLEIRRHDLELPGVDDTRFVILVAAKLGVTRLIDNFVVEAGD